MVKLETLIPGITGICKVKEEALPIFLEMAPQAIHPYSGVRLLIQGFRKNQIN